MIIAQLAFPCRDAWEHVSIYLPGEGIELSFEEKNGVGNMRLSQKHWSGWNGGLCR